MAVLSRGNSIVTGGCRARHALGRALILLLLSCGHGRSHAEEPQHGSDLSQLSLEELTKIEVTSVARKDHELFRTPAAVFVITHDEIRRSGISSIPELLRMVPGMQVAQIYANEWAVSSRGFNGRFADKMLVLVDGRSIYSEIDSGVYWDQNDLLLEDIDRIEVIRGPGGTLWGANAVNGIINIITLKSDQTQGGLLVDEVGRIDEQAAARYGGSRGDQIHYRTYVKFLQRNELVTDSGSGAHDAGSSVRAGVRADWQPRHSDSLAFHGDIYRGRGTERIYFQDPGDISMSNVETAGGYVLGRWEHRFARCDTALQSYYNQQNHSELAGGGRDDTFDLDSIVHLPRYKRNEATGGAGYRITSDKIVGYPSVFNHEHHRDTLYSVFFEDDLTVIPEKVTLTGGFKLIHNSYTGFELQPGLRGIWTPNEKHSVWAAVSKAVRTPSVQEEDLHFLRAVPAEGPIETDVLAEGNPGFRSEVVHAYEGGYRQAMSNKLSLDVAGFFNEYKRLRSQTELAPYVTTLPTVTVVIPVIYDNRLQARSDGVEAALSWTASRSLRIDTSYSWINSRRWLSGGSVASSGDSWATPTNTLNVRGTWTFARRWSVYSSVYAVSQLSINSSSEAAPVGAYVRADAHVTFSVNERLQVTAGGNNLQRSRHAEFNPSDDGYSVGSQVPRSAFAKVVWSF